MSTTKTFTILWYRAATSVERAAQGPGPMPEEETIEATSQKAARDYARTIATQHGWHVKDVRRLP